MMADNDSITVVGTVGLDPDYKVDGNGLPRVSLRIASDQWQKNRESGLWERGEPNWYSVVAFRFLATNVAASVHKGERVIVTGNLKLHEWVDGSVKRVRPEIVANSIGHDLNWGTSSYTRPVKSARLNEEDRPAADGFPSGEATASVDGDADAFPSMALDSETEGEPVDSTKEAALPF
jgi:single-strand DNA-binding protein